MYFLIFLLVMLDFSLILIYSRIAALICMSNSNHVSLTVKFPINTPVYRGVGKIRFSVLFKQKGRRDYWIQLKKEFTVSCPKYNNICNYSSTVMKFNYNM